MVEWLETYDVPCRIENGDALIVIEMKINIILINVSLFHTSYNDQWLENACL